MFDGRYGRGDAVSPGRWLRADMAHRAGCIFDRVEAIDGALVGTTDADRDPQANFAQVVEPPAPAGWPALLAAAAEALARRGRPPVVSAVDAPAERLAALGWRPLHRYAWHRVPLDPARSGAARSGAAPSDAAPSDAAPSDVDLVTVTGDAERRAFLAIYAEVFAPDEADRAWREGIARTLGPPRSALRWIHALALLGGEPVGIAAVAHDGHTAGLHALAVRPAARGRGIGRRLTRWRIAQAAAAGCREGFLQTEEDRVRGWQARAGVEVAFETVFWTTGRGLGGFAAG